VPSAGRRLEEDWERLVAFYAFPKAHWKHLAVGEQLHRALEVGEEDRDLLPFALKRSLGGEDLLGQVLGRVGLGGGESLSRRRRGG
jgi:hypothetical protein